MPDEFQTETATAAGRRWLFGGCEYLELSRQLLIHGKPAKLEAKPLDVLQCLLEEPTRVHTKDALIGAVWDVSTSDQSLATAISKLRKAFGGNRDDIILNVSGSGYRVAVPVECLSEEGPAPPRFRLQAGDLIPHRSNWRATQPLGAGNPPMVWLGEQSKTREVRVFKFAADGIRLHALQREVSLSRFLKQSLPNDDRFVRLIDCELEKFPFLIEAEYSGMSLFDWSKTASFTSMPLDKRISLLAELVEAIAAAHALGILHNDLKPGNVLVAPQTRMEGGDGLPLASVTAAAEWKIKVADFGIATLSQPERLRALQITYHDGQDQTADAKAATSTPSGSAMYRAPELLSDAVPSVRCDVYALGVMLYQIACGDFVASLSPGWESRVPDALLCRDIADAANVDPGLRIQTAAELALRLRTLERRRAEEMERIAAAADAQRVQKALADARLRRPWVIFAVAALSAGLCASLFFYRRAIHERDLAEKQNATSSAMFHFLADDLLGQSNPQNRGPDGALLQQSLLQAIDKALPQIDTRFKDQPQTAGQLHETVADALQNQTNFVQADSEYESAAQRFLVAEGPLSQNAIICELKRANSAIQGKRPGGMQQAKDLLSQQKRLVAKLPEMSPELRAWLALAEASLMAEGAHPEQALPTLKQAIQIADSTRGVSPAAELALRRRLFSAYLRSGDAPNAETAARAAVAAATSLKGAGSPSVLFAQMDVEEALFAQGKYRQTVEEITQSYPQFVGLLGPANLYTLQTLSTRAASEGNLNHFDEAIRDDLSVYESARSNPSARMFEVTGLVDAGSSECRVHRFASGIDHVRQAYDQTRAQPGTAPGLVGGIAFTLAECLLSQQEFPDARKDKGALVETSNLLGSMNVEAVAHFSANPGFAAMFDVARARLALAQGDYRAARQFAAHAAPSFAAAGADAYEKSLLQQVESSLDHLAKKDNSR